MCNPGAGQTLVRNKKGFNCRDECGSCGPPLVEILRSNSSKDTERRWRRNGPLIYVVVVVRQSSYM